jgi:hypothetical protein
MSDCSKIPYRSCTEATLAMRAIRRKKTARGLNGPTGAYLCPTCKRWHLTSKSRTQTPPWQKSRSVRRSRTSSAS